MRVLVAIDNSELSESALKAIGPWARAAGAEVVLLTVRQPGRIHETTSTTALHVMVPQGTPSGQSLPVRDAAPISAEDRTQALERARTETEERLRETAARLLPGVRSVVRVDMSDDVPHTIAGVATEIGADFIAMGTHGRKGMAHALMGSVAEAVLRASAVPVLLVREGMRLPAAT